MSQRVRAAAIGKLHPPFPRFEAASGFSKMLNCPLGVGEAEHNLADGEGPTGEVRREEGGIAHECMEKKAKNEKRASREERAEKGEPKKASREGRAEMTVTDSE